MGAGAICGSSIVKLGRTGECKADTGGIFICRLELIVLMADQRTDGMVSKALVPAQNLIERIRYAAVGGLCRPAGHVLRITELRVLIVRAVVVVIVDTKSRLERKVFQELDLTVCICVAIENVVGIVVQRE